MIIADDTMTTMTPDAWGRILANLGRDNVAITDWMTLVHSDAGKTPALNIIHKIFKKKSGNDPVTNISGFVVRSVRNAWHNTTDTQY